MSDSQQQTQEEVMRMRGGEVGGWRGQEGHLSLFKPTLLASGDPGRGAIV